MVREIKPKKRVIVSYKNLTPELKVLLKTKYPFGFSDFMMRIEKGPGDFFYAVMLETDEVNYLVKIDVKVDELIDDDGNDDDEGYYDDEIRGADQIPDTDDEEEED